MFANYYKRLLQLHLIMLILRKPTTTPQPPWVPPPTSQRSMELKTTDPAPGATILPPVISGGAPTGPNSLHDIWLHSSSASLSSSEQTYGVNIKALSDCFHGLQRKVSFAALHPAHVCPMDAQHVGEGFLREIVFPAIFTKASPDLPLQLSPSHSFKTAWLLLEALQTLK